MSTQTIPRLTIVEVAPAAARRPAARLSTAAKKSSAKRPLPTATSAKKRTASKKTLTRPKAKVKTVARTVKFEGSAQNKSKRRQSTQQQSVVEMAVPSIVPIEIDVPFWDAEPVEPRSDLVVEEISAAMELSLAEPPVVEEELTVESVENVVDPKTPLLTLEMAAEMEVIAEPQLTLTAAPIVPSDEPIQRVFLAEPQSIPRTFAFQWNAFLQVLVKGWNWLQQRLKKQQAKKRLRVCETVSLGEKRFIAVVQVDGEQFLVGGSSSSVSTLAHLEKPREFSDVFRRYEQSGMQA